MHHRAVQRQRVVAVPLGQHATGVYAVGQNVGLDLLGGREIAVQRNSLSRWTEDTGSPWELARSAVTTA